MRLPLDQPVPYPPPKEVEARAQEIDRMLARAHEHRVSTYAARWAKGLDIYTGEPLTGADRIDWIRSKRENRLRGLSGDPEAATMQVRDEKARKPLPPGKAIK